MLRSAITAPMSPKLISPLPLLMTRLYVPGAVPVPPSTVPAKTRLSVVVMVTSLNNCVLRDVPFKSMAPLVVMLPRNLFTPVPSKVKLANGVVLPKTAKSMAPLPLPMVKVYAPLVLPKVMSPLLVLVKVLLAGKLLVRDDVPFKSIAPVVFIKAGRTLLPLPLRVTLVNGVVSPTFSAKLTAPEPVLIVRVFAPLIT